jgi:UDP-N-acetylmuramate--alanine ligase
VPRIHLIGVNGVGVSALGWWYLTHGWRVTGTDRQLGQPARMLARAGAKIREGVHPAWLDREVKRVVYSAAVPPQHAERRRAMRLGILQEPYHKALGRLANAAEELWAVAGTHGKSTTTYLLAELLAAAGRNPTAVVGALVPTWEGRNFRKGEDQLWIVEADEYNRHFYALRPTAAVITNVEWDHPETFAHFGSLRRAFLAFVRRLRPPRLLVVPQKLVAWPWPAARIITFGITPSAELYAVHRRVAAGGQSFEVFWRKRRWGRIYLPLAGKHNMLNFLAALAALLAAKKISPNQAQSVAKTLHPLWRRLEQVGYWQGVKVISDYAHHPTELAATYTAAEEYFPGRRLVMLFQPHHPARTRALAADFVRVLRKIPHLILTEIYQARQKEKIKFSSRMLARQLPQADFVPHLRKLKRVLRKKLKRGDVLLACSAGPLDDWLRERLCAKSHVTANP